MNAFMEWKLKFHETDLAINYEIYNGLYMIINYGNCDIIQFRGMEEHLQSMGFTKVGEVNRLSLQLTIHFITIPCYKGIIRLPNGENVDIVVCLDEHDENATLAFPYKAFEKILIDVNKREVKLNADVAKLKSIIENSNRKYMEELERVSFV